MYRFKFDSDWSNKVTMDTQEEYDLNYILEVLKLDHKEEEVEGENENFQLKLTDIQDKEKNAKSSIDATTYELEGVQAYFSEALSNFDLATAQKVQNNVQLLQQKIEEQQTVLNGLEQNKKAIVQELENQQKEQVAYKAYVRTKEALCLLPKERSSKVLLHEDQLSPYLGKYFEILKGEMLDDHGENS